MEQIAVRDPLIWSVNGLHPKAKPGF